MGAGNLSLECWNSFPHASLISGTYVSLCLYHMCFDQGVVNPAAGSAFWGGLGLWEQTNVWELSMLLCG